MTTQTTTQPEVTITAGRFEVQAVADEPGVYWFFDYRTDRAEFVRVSLTDGGRGFTAYAENVKPGSRTYSLHQARGEWRCNCKAGQAGRRCYHRTVVEVAFTEWQARVAAARQARMASWDRVGVHQATGYPGAGLLICCPAGWAGVVVYHPPGAGRGAGPVRIEEMRGSNGSRRSYPGSCGI